MGCHDRDAKLRQQPIVTRKKLTQKQLDEANSYCVKMVGLPVVEDKSSDSDSWKAVSARGDFIDGNF